MWLTPRAWLHVAARKLLGRDVALWHHEAYRLPLSSIESQAGIDPRRADLALWYLLETRVLAPRTVRVPCRIGYPDLARVHTAAYLESLSKPDVLARIFGVDPWDVQPDTLLRCVRLACRATLDAARQSLRGSGPQLNLLGGFHHAAPQLGAGLCPLNDIAVAIAVLRHEGFAGQVAVLDLDAHPPDGLATCLQRDERSWIGSLSGCDWGPLDDVDETVLPEGCQDEPYLHALRGLLGRMPRAQLVFVIAGGDVLEGDRLGKLGLSLDGARRRDLQVIQVLGNRPSVWLPGGGYQRHQGWRALAGTGIALATGLRRAIPSSFDPLRYHYSRIARDMDRAHLTGRPSSEGFAITEEDLQEALGMSPPGPRTLLGYYSAEGVEHALSSYGFLPHLGRLGYGRFRVSIDGASAGERVRLTATADQEEYLLVECVLERRDIAGSAFLYVNWLSLRDPRARFSALRPRLPGQEVPGLGMAREMGQLLARMARRLGLAGVAFRPAWFHVAYTARQRFQLTDPAAQGRFEALIRDLGHLPLLQVTTAIAEGQVLRNGLPYRWESALMAHFFEAPPLFRADVRRELERTRFELASQHHPSPSLSSEPPVGVSP